MKKNIFLIPFIFLVSLLYCQKESNLVSLSDDYKKHGLNPSNVPEVWEDGLRTNLAEKNYEWWYYDCYLEDGTTVVLTFLTRNTLQPTNKLGPLITVNIERPDGSRIFKSLRIDPKLFYASKEKCDVKFGKNYFRGDLKFYEIHVEDKDFNLDIKLTRTTESWRAKTGHVYYGKEKKDFFAWVVPVPKGNTEVKFTYKGKETSLKGSAYHDHNWANIPPLGKFNHWYWARAEIGPYTVVAWEIIASKKYNYESTVLFNISKNGKTIEDDESKTKMSRSFGKPTVEFNKELSDNIIFNYNSPEDKKRIEVSFVRETNIDELDLFKYALKSSFLAFLAKKVAGVEPAYFRMIGSAQIKIHENNQLIETHSSPKAIWELMYLGNPHD